MGDNSDSSSDDNRDLMSLSGLSGINSSRSRTRFLTWQVEQLEKVFNVTHYPDLNCMLTLAKKTGIDTQKMQIWFQNRRAKWRKHSRLSNFGGLSRITHSQCDYVPAPDNHDTIAPTITTVSSLPPLQEKHDTEGRASEISLVRSSPPPASVSPISSTSSLLLSPSPPQGTANSIKYSPYYLHHRLMSVYNNSKANIGINPAPLPLPLSLFPMYNLHNGNNANNHFLSPPSSPLVPKGNDWCQQSINQPKVMTMTRLSERN